MCCATCLTYINHGLRIPAKTKPATRAGSLCRSVFRCLHGQNPVHQQTSVAFGDGDGIGRHREAADLALPVAAVGIRAFEDDAGQKFRSAGLALVLLGDIDPGRADWLQATSRSAGRRRSYPKSKSALSARTPAPGHCGAGWQPVSHGRRTPSARIIGRTSSRGQ